MESVNKIREILNIKPEAVGVKYTDEIPSVQLDSGKNAPG